MERIHSMATAGSSIVVSLYHHVIISYHKVVLFSAFMYSTFNFQAPAIAV